MNTDFTRIVLPDGNGRTVNGQLGFQIGDEIHTGDVVEWHELNGYRVYDSHFSESGRFDLGKYVRGTCLFLLVS